MPTQSNLIKGLGWITVSVLVWVPLFPIAKRVLPIVDAFTLGSVRYAIGIVLLVALVVAIEGRQALRYEGRFLAATVFAGGALAGDLLVFLGALSWITYTLAAARFPRWSPLRWTALTCLPGTAGLFFANVLAVQAGIAAVPSEAALGRSFAAIEIGGAALVIGALVANNLYLRGRSRSL